jgi:hypothetical protein
LAKFKKKKVYPSCLIPPMNSHQSESFFDDLEEDLFGPSGSPVDSLSQVTRDAVVASSNPPGYTLQPTNQDPFGISANNGTAVPTLHNPLWNVNGVPDLMQPIPDMLPATFSVQQPTVPHYTQPPLQAHGGPSSSFNNVSVITATPPFPMMPQNLQWQPLTLELGGQQSHPSRPTAGDQFRAELQAHLHYILFRADRMDPAQVHLFQRYLEQTHNLFSLLQSPPVQQPFDSHDGEEKLFVYGRILTLKRSRWI